jgi:O-antigen ligase
VQGGRGRLNPVQMALALLGVAALASMACAGLPGSLALSSIGMLAAAALVLWTGEAAQRSGAGQLAFSALAWGLLLTGLLSTVLALIQYFLPTWPDGVWLAANATPGRSAGNLRQPNHLSSLLLWSIVALVGLAEVRAWSERRVAALMACLVVGVALTASRTGGLGLLLLAAWGALDKGLRPAQRRALLAAPVLFALCWWGLGEWAQWQHKAYIGDDQLHKSDLSSSRFGIWANAWSLVRAHPWTGVGWGEFNFAWSLTPFPGRPVAFFDHTHNIVLQLAVELGLPLAALVLGLLGWGLWLGFARARAAQGVAGVLQRAAWLMVLMMVLHSQLEYPLWYAYFLLPTAFAWGLCLGEAPLPDEVPPLRPTAAPRAFTPLAIAGFALALGGFLAVRDYQRVVAVYTVFEGAAPLDQRIQAGEGSWLFAHHAHYADATMAEHPSERMASFASASHYLLDSRLMIAWAKAYHEAGDDERAKHLAQRLFEFNNEASDAFFEPCADDTVPPEQRPFQCQWPTKALDYRDFR